MLAYGLCVGLAIGVMGMLAEYLVFRRVTEIVCKRYVDEIRERDKRIKNLMKSLNIEKERGERNAGICRLGNKIRSTGKEDPDWKLDVPIDYYEAQ